MQRDEGALVYIFISVSSHASVMAATLASISTTADSPLFMVEMPEVAFTAGENEAMLRISSGFSPVLVSTNCRRQGEPLRESVPKSTRRDDSPTLGARAGDSVSGASTITAEATRKSACRLPDWVVAIVIVSQLRPHAFFLEVSYFKTMLTWSPGGTIEGTGTAVM